MTFLPFIRQVFKEIKEINHQTKNNTMTTQTKANPIPDQSTAVEISKSRVHELQSQLAELREREASLNEDTATPAAELAQSLTLIRSEAHIIESRLSKARTELAAATEKLEHENWMNCLAEAHALNREVSEATAVRLATNRSDQWARVAEEVRNDTTTHTAVEEVITSERGYWHLQNVRNAMTGLMRDLQNPKIIKPMEQLKAIRTAFAEAKKIA